MHSVVINYTVADIQVLQVANHLELACHCMHRPGAGQPCSAGLSMQQAFGRSYEQVVPELRACILGCHSGTIRSEQAHMTMHMHVSS